MKSRIESKFSGQDYETCDAAKIYVMDYTNQTSSVRGVEWNDAKPTDIDVFIIENTPLLDITFCAFKENTIKLAGKTTEEPHCEGVLFPTGNSDTTWTSFIELKYPKRKNLGNELKKARTQLLQTLDLFRNQGIVEAKRLVYLIFSAPKYSDKTPFESWSMKPDELKKIRKEKYAIMRGINNFEVISKEKLKV